MLREARDWLRRQTKCVVGGGGGGTDIVVGIDDSTTTTSTTTSSATPKGTRRHDDPLARVRGGCARLRQARLPASAEALRGLPRRRDRGWRRAGDLRALPRDGARRRLEDGWSEESRRLRRR